ncbi:unnamed protein product, partial [Chrysoparadoxa australica]
NDYEIITSKPAPEKKQWPEFVLECAALYERYLQDDPDLVPPQNVKNRNKKYIDNTIDYIQTFLKVLSSNGYKLSHTHITAINEEAVSLFYEYLEHRYENQEIGEVTWNRHIGACRYWIETLIRKFNYQLTNPFTQVTPKKVNPDPQFLDLAELEKLFDTIAPENGWGERGKVKIEHVNYYRPWLHTYYLVSVFVGARPKEIVQMKWADVSQDYLIIQNSKMGGKNYVYIHPDLALVLASLQAKAKSEDEYILVPDYKNRNQLQSFCSKAFNHFIKLSGIKKEVTMYNLRHTYVNALYNLIGEEGLSVHHKKETAVRHYLSKRKKHDLQAGKKLFNINVDAYI